jgi:hypothetical protein
MNSSDKDNNTRWTPINPPMQVIFQGKSATARFLGDVPGNSPSYLVTQDGKTHVTSIDNVTVFDQNTPITPEYLDTLQSALRSVVGSGSSGSSGSGASRSSR